MKPRLAVVVCAALAAAFAGSVAASDKKDIVDTAVAAGQFKTLAKLLGDADLVDALKGDGPFTVFAPTDEAFKKVPKETLESLAADKKKLAKVLKYHVIKGNVESSDAMKLDGKSAETLAGAKLPVRVKGNNLMVGKAKVTKADVKCKNGVIHIIDTVLIPD
jgi:uncharacterized surface protein with fasciclin (FAS1) repeats